MTNPLASVIRTSGTSASRIRRLFLRFASVILCLIALVALVVGGTMVASQHWPEVEATVGACQTTTNVTGAGSSRSTSHQTTCAMTWQDSTGTHHASVGYGAGKAPAGPTAPIRVHGDVAVEPTPAWEGYTALGVGLVLLVVGIVTLVRSIRRRGV